MSGLSAYWTGSTASRLRGKDEIARLAIALGPVRSVIRLVDDSRPPMSVDWAQVGTDDHGSPLSQSHTDFRAARIAVNPLPVLEDRLDPADQIDVCVGQALHEASHSLHTRDRWLSTLVREEGGREVPAFEPLRVAAWLLNVAEDPRAEGLTAADWPGFAPYFDRLLDWLWDEGLRHGTGGLPEDVGHTIADRLRVAFLGARFPGKYGGARPEVAEEARWWGAWQHDYATGRTTPVETVQRGLDRLAEDPDVEAEMAEMTVRDAERKAHEDLRQLLQRLSEEGVEGAPRACAVCSVEQSTLSEEDAEAVRQLVREGLVTITPVIRHRGASAPDMRVRKPLESAGSRRSYVGRPDPMVEAVRAALVFRQERPQHDEKLHRSGEVDDEELWRFATGDLRVFTERVVESRPDTALGMLVDISGSMLGSAGSGSKLRTAQRLAQILLAAASDTEGVTPYVWAHTGDSDAGAGADVFTIWEPGDPASRLGLIATLDNGNNYDGYAIAYCVDRLRQCEQPQRVLLVLSDGYPAGARYGGAEAQQHMRQVCRWAEGQDVTVIQIAIDESLRPSDQAAMFGEGNWIPYTSDRQVPRDLAAILGRYAR